MKTINFIFLLNTDSFIIKRRCRYTSLKCLASALVLISGLLPLVCCAQTLRSLTIKEALSFAMEHNPKIIQYKERLEGKKYDDHAAFGNFLPTITLNAGYTAMNAPLTMDLDPIRDAMIGLQASMLTTMAIDSFARANAGAVSPAVISGFGQKYGAAATQGLETAVPHFIDTLKKQYYPNANLTITQPLFMGGKILAAKKAAVADEKAARMDLKRFTNEIIQETFNNYCAVELLKSVIDVRKNVVNAMKTHEKDAARLCDAGMIAKTNVLRTRVAVAEAQRNLDEDVDRLTLARLGLAKSLGLSDSEMVDSQDTLTLWSVSDSVKTYLMEADSGQPMLGLLTTRIDAAHANVMAKRAEMLPRVAAFGKAELITGYLSALEPDWAAGVTFSMDIFDGTKNSARFKSANSLVSEMQALFESTRHDVRLWVRKSYVECQSANRMYCKLACDEALAQENLRQCTSRFENGYATSIDVIDAHLALEKNRMEKITALYNFNRSYMDLCTAIGESQKALVAATTKEKML